MNGCMRESVLQALAHEDSVLASDLLTWVQQHQEVPKRRRCQSEER